MRVFLSRNLSTEKPFEASFKEYMHQAADLIWPPQCPLCKELIAGRFGLCGSCWGELCWINRSCVSCAVPLFEGLDAEPENLQCDHCLTMELPWQRAFAPLIYDQTSKRLTLALKKRCSQHLLELAGGWMADVISKHIGPKSVLVPVPLHWRREWLRGHNQAAELAAEISGQTGVPMLSNALIRSRATTILARYDSAERRRIMANALSLNHALGPKLEGQHVILVDDVMSSGATLQAASMALQAAFPERIDVLTLSRTSMD